MIANSQRSFFISELLATISGASPYFLLRDLAPLREAIKRQMKSKFSNSELEAFLKDTRPDAYERQVERLLQSPHYGERWARHWLDLAHYADSDGYEKDLPRPWAWRYRNWVINAFNNDMPFDQFTVEQIAGDLLPKPTTEQMVATGFLNTLGNLGGLLGIPLVAYYSGRGIWTAAFVTGALLSIIAAVTWLGVDTTDRLAETHPAL